jgi:hypothetical protein
MEPRRLFESMLPMNYLENVVCQATSKNLEQIQERPLSFDEFMLYIGYWLSMTLISVDRRQDYWKTSSDFLSPAQLRTIWQNQGAISTDYAMSSAN